MKRRITTMFLTTALASLAFAGPAAAHGPPKVTGGPEGTVRDTFAEFTISYTEPSPFQRMECKLDAGEWEACGDLGVMGGTATKRYENLADGQHSFQVRRTTSLPVDPLNDPTPSTPRTWIVDTSEPVAT